MFRDVLVVVDATAPAPLMDLAAWARGWRARVTIALVMPRGAPAEMAEVAEPLVQSLTSRAIHASLTMIEGDVVAPVIERVRAGGYNLILLTRADSGDAPWRIGRRERMLLRDAPCPVWLWRDRAPKTSVILAAVDPDDTDRERDALNLSVLTFASILAARSGADLAIGHAWSVAGGAALADRPFLRGSPQQLNDARAEAFSRRHRQVSALLCRAQLGTTVHRVLIREGDPPQVLPDLAAECGADLMILGTVGRRGLAGLIRGNTAERVAAAVSRSVLVVRPVVPVRPHVDGSRVAAFLSPKCAAA